MLKPMELMVEASPRRIFANAHTYHINSISVNSDAETYLSADDLRVNLWHLEITDQSFNIVDIKVRALSWPSPPLKQSLSVRCVDVLQKKPASGVLAL